jgi:hypothetical protein
VLKSTGVALQRSQSVTERRFEGRDEGVIRQGAPVVLVSSAVMKALDSLTGCWRAPGIQVGFLRSWLVGKSNCLPTQTGKSPEARRRGGGGAGEVQVSLDPLPQPLPVGRAPPAIRAGTGDPVSSFCSLFAVTAVPMWACGTHCPVRRARGRRGPSAVEALPSLVSAPFLCAAVVLGFSNGVSGPVLELGALSSPWNLARTGCTP